MKTVRNEKKTFIQQTESKVLNTFQPCHNITQNIIKASVIPQTLSKFTLLKFFYSIQHFSQLFHQIKHG